MTSEVVTRGLLFRWAGWFTAANTLILSAISLRYLSGLGGSQPIVVWIYLATNFIGFHGLLAVSVVVPVVSPVILLYPRKKAVLLLGVLAISAAIALLTLDSLVWSQSRFHLNLFTMQILGNTSWTFAVVMFLIGLLFESLLAGGVWRWVCASGHRKGILAGSLLGLSLVASQGIHAWADASYFVPVTATASRMPLYRGVTAKRFFAGTGLVDIKQSRERSVARSMTRGLDTLAASGLRYPQAPLQCVQPKELNLLLVVIDAMRSDMITPDVMPTLATLAKSDATEFTRHYSGGNSSQAGLFSIFYGLPPTYFNSFAGIHQPPVLMLEIQKQNYQMGIFSSSDMYHPAELDRTAFATVTSLRNTAIESTEAHWDKVQTLNREWFKWVANLAPEQPFFGFLYYDSTKLGPGYSPPAGLDMSESERAFDEYKAAMRSNDALVAAVLADLRQRSLYENTVIVVTSDHGDEFDDSGMGFLGHGSAYNRYQLQVPLIIHWPGRPPGRIEHRTNHYGLAPTLMQEFFGCSNPASDYSVGVNLFNGPAWDWMVAGSYYNYAVLEPGRITVTFPDGSFEVRDADYQLLTDPGFDISVIEGVMQENRRFHR